MVSHVLIFSYDKFFSYGLKENLPSKDFIFYDLDDTVFFINKMFNLLYPSAFVLFDDKLENLGKMIFKGCGCRLLNINDVKLNNIGEVFQRKSKAKITAIDNQKNIVFFYYFVNMLSYKEISVLTGLSEQRISYLIRMVARKNKFINKIMMTNHVYCTNDKNVW